MDALITAVEGMAINVKNLAIPRDKFSEQLTMLASILKMLRERNADAMVEPDTVKLLKDERSRDTMEALLTRLKKGH